MIDKQLMEIWSSRVEEQYRKTIFGCWDFTQTKAQEPTILTMEVFQQAVDLVRPSNRIRWEHNSGWCMASRNWIRTWQPVVEDEPIPIENDNVFAPREVDVVLEVD